MRTSQDLDQNRPHTWMAFLFAIALFGGLCFVMLYLVSQFDFSLGGTKLLTDWRYLNMDEPAAFANVETEGIPVHSLTGLRQDSGAPYIHLSAAIPESDHARQLLVRTFHNQIEVRLNGESVFQALDRKSIFSPRFSVKIPLQPGGTQRIEIVMRSEFLPQLGVFITDDSPALNFSGLLSGLLLLLAASAATVGLYGGFRRRSRPLVLNALATIAICAASVMMSGGFSDGTLLWLRASVIVMMLAGFFLYYRSAYMLSVPESSWGFLMNAGLLYAAVVITCQYEQLFISLVRCFGVYYLLTLLWLIPRLRANGWRIRRVQLVMDVLMLLSYLFYWFRFLIGTGIDGTSLLCLAAIMQLITGLLETLHQANSSKQVANEGETLMRFRPVCSNSLDVVVDLFLQNEQNRRHSTNVSLYSYEICRAAGMREKEAEQTAQAAFLHDIGKVRVPQEIMDKPGRLTEEEFSVLRHHIQYGLEILSSCQGEFYQMAAKVAEQHHERYDGGGYLKLQGDEIEKHARIVAVADVFDAVTTDRPYKKAWSFEEGFAYIKEHRGSFFEPAAADSFLKCREQIGSIYNMAQRNHS